MIGSVIGFFVGVVCGFLLAVFFYGSNGSIE